MFFSARTNKGFTSLKSGGRKGNTFSLPHFKLEVKGLLPQFFASHVHTCKHLSSRFTKHVLNITLRITKSTLIKLKIHSQTINVIVSLKRNFTSLIGIIP